MYYIFIDESGDLGFSDKSSKWFIITLVLSNNHRQIEKVIKKVHKKLRKKYKRVRELHAYHSDSITKKRILRGLSDVDDCKVLCVVLNKDKVYTNLKNQKSFLYNYTANILLDRLYQKNIIDKEKNIIIYIDQKETNKFLLNNFEWYLKRKVSGWDNNISIKIKPSHTEKCLQAVDFISWAVFRKYERNDEEFYNIIKDIIVEENLLFP